MLVELKWHKLSDKLPTHREQVMIVTLDNDFHMALFVTHEGYHKDLKDKGIIHECDHDEVSYRFCCIEERGSTFKLERIRYWMSIPEVVYEG